MDQHRTDTLNRIFFTIGLLLLVFAIVFNRALLIQLSQLLGTSIQIGGTEGLARVWVLKIVFLVISLPFLFYKYRFGSSLKFLFDLSMGLVFSVMLLLLLEGYFYWQNRAQPSSGPGLAVSYSETYVDLDDFMGYRLRPNLEVFAKQTQGDSVIYDVIYSIDEYGRRITPVSNRDERSAFILFLGGSFTFGDGVEDNQTLPAYVGQFAPAHMPYNYGVPGFGTQQVLTRLQTIDSEEIPEPQGVAVYSFICPHIDRVVGSLLVQNTSGTYMPYYTLDANEKLVRKGTLVSGRPVLSVIYAIVGISHTADYFNIDLPRLNDSHFKLVAKIIEESADTFGEKFADGDFYVLFFPGRDTCISKLTPHLDKAGINYLSYPDLFSPNESDLWLPDGHPTAQAYEIVAERVVKDLGLTESKNRTGK